MLYNLVNKKNSPSFTVLSSAEYRLFSASAGGGERSEAPCRRQGDFQAPPENVCGGAANPRSALCTNFPDMHILRIATIERNGLAMENFELLMEKYKNEMIQLARRAVNQVNEENTAYMMQSEQNRENVIGSETREVVRENEATPITYQNGQGSLKIKVFTGNEAFPIMSALVKVLDGEDLLFQEFTDQSGMVSEVYLPAPSSTISQSPGNEKGYSTYTVVVSHPRFNTVIMENVPVFEGIESIQPVAMEPINNLGSEIINETEPFMSEERYNA